MLDIEIIKNHNEVIKLTSIYPEKVENFGIAYLTLGLYDEIEELLDKIYDNQDIKKLNSIYLEFGDVLWYAHGLSNKFNIEFDYILNELIECVKLTIDKTHLTCIESNLHLNTLENYLPVLANNTIPKIINNYNKKKNLTGLIKKLYRDNKKIEDIKEEVGDLIVYELYQIFTSLLVNNIYEQKDYELSIDNENFSIDTYKNKLIQDTYDIINNCVKLNSTKLLDRLEREQIQGDGDNR